MMDKLLDILNEIVEEKESSPVISICEKTDLRNDLGFDSFDLALLTAKLEDEYGVDVFEDGIVRTVGEILQKLEK